MAPCEKKTSGIMLHICYILSTTKHIDVQYHFVRDMVEAKRVLLVKVDTLKNVVDALTKSVST